MTENKPIDLRIPIKQGLVASIVSLSVSIIGMVELFSKRDLIAGVLSLGQVFLFIAPVALGYITAQKAPRENRGASLLYGFVTGFVSAIPLTIAIILEANFNVRQFLPNVSPATDRH